MTNNYLMLRKHKNLFDKLFNKLNTFISTMIYYIIYLFYSNLHLCTHVPLALTSMFTNLVKSFKVGLSFYFRSCPKISATDLEVGFSIFYILVFRVAC